MHCPICNHSATTVILESQDYSLTQESFSVYQCMDCNFRFTGSIPSQDTIGRYYKFIEYISHTDVKNGWLNRLYHLVRSKTLAQKTNWVQSLFTGHKGHLLDIGAGTGAFVHAMFEKNWKVTGLEPDASTRDKAFENYKIQLKSTDAIFDLPENEYEVITMWHVLEHVHELKPYIHQCYKSLKHNGRLIIAVPNFTSFDASFYKKFWAAYDLPRHLYHFSPTSMELLLQQYGFDIVTIKPMWFDSFYVSILSEKYKKSGKLGLIRAAIIGSISNLIALMHPNKASSLIYEVKKKSDLV